MRAATRLTISVDCGEERDPLRDTN